ncbi:hypothetical protein STPYR_11054 [uncultured Stenotrophomonas sp.]|uniref:Uncharacterized protein n=1 Tax=uncultured Stenotrophomonas sp. TaxID=165438 RepID=A0A1Y5Q8G9_9GAMM|nr:hypothetical protein STPYR_11054 [uncultured Stenotrophomonas sp.]
MREMGWFRWKGGTAAPAAVTGHAPVESSAHAEFIVSGVEAKAAGQPFGLLESTSSPRNYELESTEIPT